MFVLESLCSLLFELANEDRLQILHKLRKEPMKVTKLSKVLDLIVQESSRHVSRLDRVMLTKKEVDGSRHVTSYGELVLNLLQGLEFVSSCVDYFTTHSVRRLPAEFTCRIGELSDSTYTDDVQVSFYNAEKVTRNAEKYILVITDRYMMNISPLLTKAFERGVKVRKIEPKAWFLPAEFEEGLLVEDVESKRLARATGLLEERLLESVDLYLYMSEKEVAGIAFPTLDWKLDYLGFSGTGERSHRLCREIFEHYWKGACPSSSVAEELYGWLKNRRDAIALMRNIAKGKDSVINKELAAELESAGLIRKGKLTMLGDILYSRLQR